jgi:ribosomal protein S18 acetylase RimI-like enzyme
VTPRRAARGDLAAIAELWRALIDHHAESLPRTTRDVTAHELDALLRDAACAAWIAERDRRAVGFCAVRVETAPPGIGESARALITELYVRPDARRRGVGRALVDAALAWARERGAARVEVRVAARNETGQSFWRSLGFGAFVDVLDRRL